MNTPIVSSINLRLYLHRSSSLPLGWIEFQHPLFKGQTYYYHPGWRIVTESDIESPIVLDILRSALAILEGRLIERNITLPQSSEGSFEIDVSQHPPLVKYYFVDHSTRTEFWLEPTDPMTSKDRWGN